MIALLVTGGLVLLFGIIMYNSLIGKKNQVKNAFAGMDVQLKKRYDLIPNLVNTVKTYMNHEKETLEKITELRGQAIAGGQLSNSERVDLDNQITKGLSGIMVQVENYPDLKANTNFIDLQRSLNEIEEQISASRRAYNASVTDFNNAIEMFPGNLFKGPMNLTRQTLFEIPETQRESVDVGQLFDS